MKLIYLIVPVCLAFSVFFAGCAEIEIPTPRQIIKSPIGTHNIKVGMTRNEVISLYGTPNIKTQVSSDDWGGSREEWFYRARYSALPIGAEYLAEDVYLYFDGDNLTNISHTPLGESEDVKGAGDVKKTT